MRNTRRRDKVIEWIVMGVIVAGSAVVIYVVGGPLWDRFVK